MLLEQIQVLSHKLEIVPSVYMLTLIKEQGIDLMLLDNPYADCTQDFIYMVITLDHN